MTARLTAGCAILLALLAGCETAETAGGALSSRLIGPAKPDPARVLAPPGAQRDGFRISRGANRKMTDMIEAPDLFSDTRELTWNGNETLGGLWIAHGEIDRAYRVRATNLRTGIVVDGALLPRHGASSPTVVVSTEAAESLGMLAGRPEEIALVAILPAPLEPPPEIMVAEAPAEDPAPETAAPPQAVVEAAPPEPVAPAAAEEAPAIDLAALDGNTAFGAEPKAETEKPTATPARPAEPAPRTPEAEAPTEVATERPVRAERSAETTAATPLRTEPTVAATRTEPVGETRLEAEAPAQPVETAAATRKRDPEPATAQEEPETAAAQPPGGIADGKPFVASGTLKNSDLASDLVRTLSAYGVSARNVSEDGGGKPRVVAGPFRTEADRDKALDLFRAIGVYGARATAG